MKTKKGSSLVELLAVIVIMGIIAAIAVPTVGSLLKKQRKKAAGQDMMTFIQNLEYYLMSMDESEKDAFPITSHSITIQSGDGWIGTKIYDDNSNLLTNLKSGSIIIALNDEDTRVESAIFKSVIYYKDGKYYGGFKDYSSGDGTVKCEKEGNSQQEII